MSFVNPAEHLSAELQRLSLLLHREILRLRASYQLSLDELRGLYISDEQVDQLVEQSIRSRMTASERDPPPAIQALTARAQAMRKENDARVTSILPWSRVVSEWGLSSFEQDVLMLAL